MKAGTLLAPLKALIRLHWMLLCIVAGLILLYALAGFFLVPYLARSQLETYVTQTLHRQVSVGDVRFNPFFLDTSIHDFQLSEADGTPLISFRHLYVNAELASLWRRAIVLKEVQLAKPNFELVIQRDGSVNLARLVPESAEPAAPQEASAPTRVHIGTLAVTEGRVGLADYTHSRPFTAAVTPIRFTLNDFRTDVGYENAYDFSGTTTSGEHLEWAGHFTVEPLGSTGRFLVQGLRVATIDSYLGDSLSYRLASGDLTLNGNYVFTLNPTFGLEVALPSIRINDLSLAERGSNATVPVTVPSVDIQEVTLSYTQRNVNVKRVVAGDARIHAALEADGSISLDRLLASTTAPAGNPDQAHTGQPATQPSAAQASAAESDWHIGVQTLQFTNATVHAEDRSVSPVAAFELTPIEATVSGWSTDPAARMQIESAVTINKDGQLHANGEIQMEPLSAQLALELSDFDLPVIQPYLATTTAMSLLSGKLSAKGDLTYAAEPAAAPPLTFKGEAQVANLRTTDQLLNEDFIKWRNLAITGIDFSHNPGKLRVERVVARQPYARVVIAEDTTLNVTAVLSPGTTAEVQERSDGDARGSDDRGTAKAAAPAQDASFPMSIRSIQIIDGSANFADYSIRPSFATGILELNGTVTGLSSDPGSRARVKLDGKVDKYAPVNIAGEVNLLSAALYTDLALDFRNMELTTFNPYSGKFAGYNISKGKLSTELKYLVQDRKLDAAHHIVIDNLEFGAKTDSKDAAPIPLKLAVALLKDRNGVIDLNLPVTGTIDDPKFRLGPIIWKAFIGLLTKIVTAPFAALGALFGGGEELAYVDFAPGSSALDPAGAEKLATLSRALVERPQLRLEVPLTVASEPDSDAIAKAALAQKVPAVDVAALDEKARLRHIQQLEATYQQLAGAAPQYPAEMMTKDGIDPDAQLKFLNKSLLEKLRPDAEALNQLALGRARAVQDALLANTELNPERVFITAERAEGKTQADAVRMEMKLE